MVLIICLLGLYCLIKNRKKCPSHLEKKPLEHNIKDIRELKLKEPEQLELGAIETLISLINQSDLQESQRGNGVHIYLHTNSQSPTTPEFGFFRSNSGQQDNRDVTVYHQDAIITSPRGRDFTELTAPLDHLKHMDNENNNIITRSNVAKVEKSQRTSLSMPMLHITPDT